MLLTNLPSDILKDRVCAHLDVAHLGKLVRSSQSSIWRDAFETLQRNLRKDLFSAEDGAGKWCWIHPSAEQCFDECEKRHGTLVRHMLKSGVHSVYRAYESFLEFNPDRHNTYLICDSDLRLRWVGAGRNAGGCMLHGYDLEWECVHHHHASHSSEEDSTEEGSSEGEMDWL